MEDKEFKEHIKEIARLELKNSFTDNLMQTLNSSFIFKYVQTLEEENQQLKDKLKKIDKFMQETAIAEEENGFFDGAEIRIFAQLQSIIKGEEK